MEILVVLALERKLILLVDALDEFVKRDDMLNAIVSLERADNISMLITSRAEPEIQDTLFFFRKLRIESNLQVGQDIRRYIEHCLESNRKLLRLNPSVRSDITESLNSMSHGM
jgi:predicted lipid carrier protein YhbT